jgi:tetratricopeptide (TPR) repeat protein
MSNENQLCKKLVLSADWDGAIAVLSAAVPPEKDNELSGADYANRAYARCFQLSKDHRDGGYDDVVTDASKALVEDCGDNRNLCIRAYAYYLNSNYEAAINDCERVIERATDDVKTKKKEACDKTKEACDAEKAADEAKTAADEAKTAQEAYCAALRPTAFARELLGIIYASLGDNLEASKHYKQALLARQTDIAFASPLLMDAYRAACAALSGI